MKIGKAFLSGLPVVVGIALLKVIGDMLFAFWRPVMSYWLPALHPVLQWGLGFFFSLVLVILIGSIAGKTVSIQKMVRTFFFRLLGKKPRPIVLVERGEVYEFAVVLENDEKEYKLLIINPPGFPGPLVVAPKEKVRATPLTLGDAFNQAASYGLKSILEKLNHSKKHSRK